MNKIKRALTGAAVLGSLVLGGNALASEPKVSAYNCPAGQEAVYVEGKTVDGENTKIEVVCRSSGKSKKRERCADQFDGKGMCMTAEVASAANIPEEAYKKGLCPTKSFCYDGSKAKAQTFDNAELNEEVGELSDAVTHLEGRVDNHCDSIGRHDAALGSLGENVQNLYQKVEDTTDYIRSVEKSVDSLLSDEDRFALGKMKKQCKDEYDTLKEKQKTLKVANEKLSGAKTELVNYLTSVQEARAENLSEMTPGALANLAQDELVDKLEGENSADLSQYTTLSTDLETAAENAKVAASDLMDYTTQLGDHPCGYEEPRKVRGTVSASGVWLGDTDFDGEVSIGVHAPVGKRSYLGGEVAGSGVGAKSESNSYESGDIQNGTQSADFRRYVSGWGVYTIEALDWLRFQGKVGVAMIGENRKNEFEVFDQPKSIQNEDLKASFDAAIGISMGKKVRFRAEEHYNNETGLYTTAGIEVDF